MASFTTTASKASQSQELANFASSTPNSNGDSNAPSLNYNGVTTANPYVYTDSQGNYFDTYSSGSFGGGFRNKIPYTTRTYTAPSGQTTTEVVDADGRVVNVLNANSAEENKRLLDTYVGRLRDSYYPAKPLEGYESIRVLENNVVDPNATNEPVVQQNPYTYASTSGNQYSNYNFDTVDVNGVSLQRKTYTDNYGGAQVEYYDPSSNKLVYQYSGTNADELAAKDQQLYNIGTYTSDSGNTEFNKTDLGTLNGGIENYTPVRAYQTSSLQGGQSSIPTPQQDTTGWTDEDYANWLAEQDAIRYDWLEQQSAADRTARSDELASLNQAQLDQLNLQGTIANQQLDKQLTSMAEQQAANQNWLSGENQLNRDYSAEQSALNYDRTLALNQQGYDYGAEQAALDRDFQQTLQQQGFDQLNLQQDKAYQQNLELLGITNEQNLNVLDKTFANNLALQQDSLAAQERLAQLQQEGQLSAINAQGQVNYDLLQLTQQGDLNRQAQQNAWLGEQQQIAQNFQSQLEADRGARRLTEMQAAGDIAMQQQSANNAFLSQQQQAQFDYQTGINNANNQAAAELLDRNLNYQLTAAERANSYALTQMDRAFANQNQTQQAQFEFASQQAADAFNRAQEMYQVQRQDAIADRDYLANARKEERALDFEYSQKERDAQNIQREQNITRSRERALDAYAIGMSSGPSSSDSQGSKRYDGKGVAA